MAPTVIFGKFEWDASKEQENIRKHDLDFYTSVIAFLDPLRIIATVRFTKRGKRIRIIGAGFWREGRKFYEAERKN